MKSRWVPDPMDGALLIALVTVVLSVTYAYVTIEQFFYYWDYAAHQDLAATTASAFRESWGAGCQAVGRSLDEDYNALAAQFSQKEMVDITLAICAINSWNRLSVGFRKMPPTE